MNQPEGSGYTTEVSPSTQATPVNLPVIQVTPDYACRPERCEMPLHIGVFFDGTNNNWEWVEEGETANQLARQKDSNVYRLYSSYPQDAPLGYYPMYLPGVGTPFPQIGDKGGTFGSGFGKGGDGRIVYGLLHVLNSIHRAIGSDIPAFYADTVMALCRNGMRTQNVYGQYTPLAQYGDAAALYKVGMDTQGGLLLAGSSGGQQRRSFLQQWSNRIAERVKAPNAKPKLTEIFIDVFGFSRGAAEARAFTTWLLQMIQGGQLCGVPAKVRFLGIFDTVASVGAPLSTPGIGGWTDGHLDWASAEALRIGTEVKNCVHLIAMHENRESFPLDYVQAPGGSLPGNCKQHAFPGMHSDVGGGYTPQDQGRGPLGRDSQKLSQIPLNRMYDAAVDAGVPLDKTLTQIRGKDPFAIHPDLQTAYDAFTAEQHGERSQQEWLLPYLAWRYQVRDRYTKLAGWARSSLSDRDDLTGGNAILLKDIAALDASDTAGEKILNGMLDMSPATSWASANRELSDLAPEARALYERIRSYPPISQALHLLFSDYVHDSFAGFRPLKMSVGGMTVKDGWEAQGYLRYRRWYAGDDTELVRNEVEQSERMLA